MRSRGTSLTMALVASSALVAVDARAQSSAACVNDAPNPYKLATNWAQLPRPFGPTNAVAVDAKDNVWVLDRCGDEGCSGSSLSPIIELSSGGKTLKNFGAGTFVNGHGIAVDKDGNVWGVDFQTKDGKGMQAIKFSPDGKVLLKLGKAGQAGPGDDVFDAPTAVAVQSNGNVLVSEGHGSPLKKARINVYDKSGKFLKSFASYGTGEGQISDSHAIALDSRDRVYVADRAGSRVNVYDKDGKFLTSWKQFGRPSGLWVDKKDMIYVADS